MASSVTYMADWAVPDVTVRSVALSVGDVEFIDTGGTGPPLVLVHGLLMNGSLWDQVVVDLARDHRCVVPTLPLGAHRRPVSNGTDLSPRGLTQLLIEFMDRLDLHDVVLVGNDTGGALVQLVLAQGCPRVGRAVLVSCEVLDNLPPGLPGRTLALAGRLPPRLFGVFMQQMRLRPLRRLPLAFGWLTLRGDVATARWMLPLLTQSGIRRDAVAVIRALTANSDVLLDAAESLAGIPQPVLLIWAGRDRVMPLETGQRLAAILPRARLVQIADSYTLVPLDQPIALAGHLREYIQERQ